METTQMQNRIEILEKENEKMKKMIQMEEKMVEIEKVYLQKIGTLEREKRQEEEIKCLRDEDFESMKNEMAVIRLEYEMVKLQIEDKKELKTENGSYKRKRMESETEESKYGEDEAACKVEAIPSGQKSEDKEDKEKADIMEKEEDKDLNLEDINFEYRVIVKGNIGEGKLEKWIEEVGLGARWIEWIFPDICVLWMKDEDDYIWLMDNKDSINNRGNFVVERYLTAEEKRRKKKIYEHVSKVKRNLEAEGIRKKAVYGDDWAKFNGWLYVYDERTETVRRDRTIGEKEWLRR